ncbi:Aldo_ket_red domain-containing protein [Cephalotus follicularis]|uniref:Aldo_ket_red domain-containing protein n=1 Tax=Cephalotus follicularis TaxID=3775 RepID=A0A1Q3BZP1_CEPFO|nr:Aldo_ket_red domain-containing protein [Cephalotus follicularis]
MGSIPKIPLGSMGKSIPVVSYGTGDYPFGANPQFTKESILHAIEVGYRHFDTSSVYQSEQPLGEAISEAINLGLIESRAQLFITSKLWCCDTHHDRVLPALHKSLQTLNLTYIDLYLIHWPLSMKSPEYEFPPINKDFLPMDFKSVWEAMEECQTLGLTKCIGVSNFSIKKLETLLATAKIPPVANQVEMNPGWQQKKLRDFCEQKGILIIAYSTLGSTGAFWGSNRVMESELLKKIAKAKGKSVAQICLRWAYEQGVIVITKSRNKERMKENISIFDWKLSPEECLKISDEIPQQRVLRGLEFVSEEGPFKSLEELWDGDI